MKNNEYWSKRFLENQKIQFRKVEKLEEQYIRLYKSLLNDIEKDMLYWYNRFAQNNNLTYSEAVKTLNKKELEEFNWNLETYTKYAKEQGIIKKTQLENASINVHKTRLDLLKLEIENKLNELYFQLDENLKKTLKDICIDSNSRSYYEISKGYEQGLEFTSISTNRVDELLGTPWTEDGINFSDRIWNNKSKLINQLEKEFKIGFIRGRNIDDISKMIFEKIYSKNKNKATAEYVTKRMIYTESAYFSERARSECYKDLGLNQYQINSALDSSTCSDCGNRDNKVYPMEQYIIGVTAPVFHPFCRCTTVPYFDDNFQNSERFARDENGNPIYVPSDMSFEEYKKKYLKGNEKNDIIDKNNKNKGNIDVHTVGKLNREIYSVVSKDITTDEVIITDERIKHIKERHPNDYERFYSYLTEIVEQPDYIIMGNKPNTALILKEIKSNCEVFKTILRLKTSLDDEKFKNSIITFMKIDIKEWNRLINNKEVLYKNE